MTEKEFQNFLDTALNELQQKQESLTGDSGFGSFQRWSLDRPTQTLTFFDPSDNVAIEADVIEIGTFALESGSWKWAWANDSASSPSSRKRAEPLKQLADITGLDLFTQENAFIIEEEAMAWELVALSIQHLAALGCYRAPSSTRPIFSFLAIMEIRRVAA